VLRVLDSVLNNGAASVTLLYETHKPVVAPEHRRAADVEVVRGRSFDVGHPHFNLRFKLPNLAALNYPFLYVDADTFVLDSLLPLWERRHDKPWIGVDHQWVPDDPRTHRDPFLNSGVQLVGDPDFYDLAAILAASKRGGAACPTRDRPQARDVRDSGAGPSRPVPLLPRDRLRLHSSGGRPGVEQLRRGLRTFGAKAHAGAGTLAG